MIRTKTKIYGETNHPDTVLSSATIAVDKWLVGAGNKSVVGLTPGPNQILITNGDGTISVLDFNGQSNKLIGTNANGDIVLVDRS